VRRTNSLRIMSIYIYNSLTRKKEEFKPQNPPEVKMYTCGVTVYDECHIGHARSLYIFDVIKRYLKYRGYKVKFVRNITDIDDKIINKAKELGIPTNEVSGKFTESYQKDLGLLGIGQAEKEPKATENINDMIKHVKGLVDKGYAYESGGDVYFRVRKFKDYGKLSGQSIDQMMTGVRKEPGENKEDPLDFALWKKSKEGEPYWQSPWGNGRPGWHIECSVMSMKYLKADTLDVHAGGRDLIFPHHENEIAQSEALTGKQFAKYWIHHGLLTINGQKMAKSLGNFVTIKDFISEYKYADILKLFFLSTHYSQPIDYNEKSIEAARQALERISILIRKAEGKDATQATSKKYEKIEDLKTKFIEAMDDDFNTPEALASIFELVTVTNKNIEDSDFLHYSRETLRELLDIFSLSLSQSVTITPGTLPLSAQLPEPTIITDEEIERRIKLRLEYKKQKKYKEADKIRKELQEYGIILEDLKDGTTGIRRKL